MKNSKPQPHKPDRENRAPASPRAKTAWSEPKLTFVEPVLTKEGDMTELTGQGFFGTFTP